MELCSLYWSLLQNVPIFEISSPRAYLHDSWGIAAHLDWLFWKVFAYQQQVAQTSGESAGSSPAAGRGPAPEKCTQSAVAMKALNDKRILFGACECEHSYI